MRRSLAYYFVEYLKNPLFALLILFAPILVALRIPSTSSDLILIVSSFVLSDLFANAFVRGGKGIAQIRPTGTRTQPEGYVLVVFFISILATSIIVNLSSQVFASVATYLGSDWTLAVFVAVVIDFCVYGDMYMRFYLRSKTTQ